MGLSFPERKSRGRILRASDPRLSTRKEDHDGQRDLAQVRREEGVQVMKVGFIGLGTMGAHMAKNAMKGGHDLVVHDINRAAAEPHLAAGAKWATSPREVAEVTEVVLTSLPGPPEVEKVATGDHGLLSGMT